MQKHIAFIAFAIRIGQNMTKLNNGFLAFAIRMTKQTLGFLAFAIRIRPEYQTKHWFYCVCHPSPNKQKNLSLIAFAIQILPETKQKTLVVLRLSSG